MRLIIYTGLFGMLAAFLRISVQRRGGASIHPSGGQGSGAEGSLDLWAQEVGGSEGSTCRAAARVRQAVLAEGQGQMGQRQVVGSAYIRGELASAWHGGRGQVRLADDGQVSEDCSLSSLYAEFF